MNITKNAIIAIAGRPNVGKSTLANAIVGEKVAIVSDKPQTTRNRITAVRNHGDCQYIFLDTPGFHKPITKLGEYMNQIVSESIADVDAVLLVVEPLASVGKGEQMLLEKFRQSKIPVLLLINKIDTVPRERILEVIAAYQNAYPFAEFVPISAKQNEGVELLLSLLEKYAAEGPGLYPEGQISDQPERQMIAEIVREKLLTALEKEIPHGIAVAVESFEEEEDLVRVGVTIYCEKDSHKGIIIGKNGAMLKRIGSLARADLEVFLGTRVFLETWVKVKENWRQSAVQLRNFGFSE